MPREEREREERDRECLGFSRQTERDESEEGEDREEWKEQQHRADELKELAMRDETEARRLQNEEWEQQQHRAHELKELAFRDETEARRLQNVLDAEEEAEHVSRRLAMELQEHADRELLQEMAAPEAGVVPDGDEEYAQKLQRRMIRKERRASLAQHDANRSLQAAG